MGYDLKITGRSIVDGTGRWGFAGDVGIVDGTLIRHHGKDALAANDKLPGRLLRHGRAA